MSIAEKYARATISSNLRDDAHHHNTESLAAVALSDPDKINGIGHLLMRVKVANDASSYPALSVKWTVIVESKSINRKWPSHVVAHKVAKASLDHFLNDRCPICTGIGHLPLAGASRPVLSDDPCPACNGQGTRALECNARTLDYVQSMVETLHDLMRHAAGRAMQKLSNDMEF